MERVTDRAPVAVRPAQRSGTASEPALAVRVVLDRSGLQGWHRQLLQRLDKAPGLRVAAVLAEGGERLPGAARLLFELERLAYRLPPAEMSLGLSAPAFQEWAGRDVGAPDLVLDLSGRGDAGPESRASCRLLWDGTAGKCALVAALLDGRLPFAELRRGAERIAAARPGTEAQGIVLASLEDCLWRTVDFLERALSGLALSRPLDALLRDKAAAPAGLRTRHIARAGVKTVARAAVRRLYRLCLSSPQWRVGWRRLDGGPDLFDLRAHPESGWTALPDDGLRFFADPFPIRHGGRTFLFVEEFPHRTGKGIVSAVEFGPRGPLGAPRPVLEAPVHLSYPFVFTRDGAAWMVPESCAAGRIDLFRATRFPGGWVKETTLVEDVCASDATLVEHGGLWWLFATVRGGGGSFSDALHLWSAPDFRGPFTPHPLNPVLIDCASARPAGRTVRRGAALWRPVQDCRETYGGALGLARITRLDPEGYSQEMTDVLRAGGPQWPGRRLHTLNQAGGLEFIDGSAPPPRRRFSQAGTQ